MRGDGPQNGDDSIPSMGSEDEDDEYHDATSSREVVRPGVLMKSYDIAVYGHETLSHGNFMTIYDMGWQSLS